MSDENKMVRAYIDFMNVGPEHQLFEPWDVPTRKRRKRKSPSLVSVAKQAAKAGIEVARYEVEPDGKINIITGTADGETTNNEWDDVYGEDKTATRQ